MVVNSNTKNYIFLSKLTCPQTKSKNKSKAKINKRQECLKIVLKMPNNKIFVLKFGEMVKEEAVNHVILLT